MFLSCSALSLRALAQKKVSQSPPSVYAKARPKGGRLSLPLKRLARFGKNKPAVFSALAPKTAAKSFEGAKARKNCRFSGSLALAQDFGGGLALAEAFP
jgi:hypothetical protein